MNTQTATIQLISLYIDKGNGYGQFIITGQASDGVIYKARTTSSLTYDWYRLRKEDIMTHDDEENQANAKEYMLRCLSQANEDQEFEYKD